MPVIPQIITEDRASGAQFIDGSLRFNSGTSHYLSRTPGSAGNRRTWTFSCWVKVGSLSQGERGTIFSSDASGALGGPTIYQNNGLRFAHAYDPTGTDYIRETVALFRDPSAWYHVVWWCDMTQSATRWKIYVNGVQQALQTPAIANGEPNQNTNLGINSADVHLIGSFTEYSYLDGYLSQAYFIDGQALGPENFGFTDPLTNTWRPKKFIKQATPNDGTTWSSTGSDPNSKISGGSIANVFSGSLTTGITINQSSSNEYVTMTTGPIQCNSTVSFFSGNGASTATMRINGSDTYKFTAGSTTQQWWDFSFSGTITKIELGYLDGSGSANAFYGIKVDGVPLVDGDTNNIGVNGFYLPMDGNTPIGEDRSGKGNNWTPVNFGGSNTIEKATGALPILNTVNGGRFATVGVRTDAYASNLVLALPLVGSSADVSNQINSGSTTKAITANGNAAASSLQSNFYSGSFSFDGSGDYLVVSENSELLINGTECTIEGWYYVNSSFAGLEGSSLPLFAQVDVANSSTSGTANFWSFADATYLYFGSSTGNMTVSKNLIPIGRWFHYAAVVTGTTNAKLFIDGVLVGSGTIGAIGSGSGRTTNLGITRSGGGGGASYLNGYIQDFRIYKGVAKYTSNFIPASTNPDILPDTPSGVAYGSALTSIPDSATEGAVAFDNGGSGYLRIDRDTNTDFEFGTGSFTIEAWVYMRETGDNIMSTTDNGNYTTGGWLFESDGQFRIAQNGGTYESWGTFSYPFGRWFHVAVTRDGSTYYGFIDGVQQWTGSTSFNNTFGSTNDLAIGASRGGTSGLGSYEAFLNGAVSNVRIVKGTAVYTSNFTPPTTPLTNITNTVLLCCQSTTSATASAVNPGTLEVNGTLSATKFSPFLLSSDINTVRGQESGYCTLNSLVLRGNGSISDGNLTFTANSSGDGNSVGTLAIPTNTKIYLEAQVNTTAGLGNRSRIGVSLVSDTNGYVRPGDQAGSWAFDFGNNGGAGPGAYDEGSYTSYNNTNSGDIAMWCIDLSAGLMWAGKNGVWFNSGNPAAGSGAVITGIPVTATNLAVSVDGGAANQTQFKFNFGQKPFKYNPPDGFQPLCLANLPRPTKVALQPDKYFNTIIYTGASPSDVAVTGVGFAPDFVWIKARTQAYSHALYDTVRGATKELHSDTTDAEDTDTNGLKSFDSDGFTVGSDGEVGDPTGTRVAWCWKAGGGTGITTSFWKDGIDYGTASAAGLDGGTITPTGASVNTESGFSIITYTGNGSASSGVTINHGLGRTPAFIITKKRSSGTTDYGWSCWHKDLGGNYGIWLNLTNARNVSMWGGYSNISSTVFSPPDLLYGNENGQTYVNYLWAEIEGFSKFGTYVGNDVVDGIYIHCGFRPAMLMIKRVDTSGTGWVILDSVRETYNPVSTPLFANTNIDEPTSASTTLNDRRFPVDFLSNGFKMRVQYQEVNGASGGSFHTYIYAAFAEAPTANLYGGQANAR